MSPGEEFKIKYRGSHEALKRIKEAKNLSDNKDFLEHIEYVIKNYTVVNNPNIGSDNFEAKWNRTYFYKFQCFSIHQEYLIARLESDCLSILLFGFPNNKK